MSISKFFFGEFAGLQLAQRNTQSGHRVVVRNVRCITGSEKSEAIALPFTPQVASILSSMRVGDPVIFHLSKKTPESKIALESMHILPYWYEDVPLEEWTSIVESLK